MAKKVNALGFEMKFSRNINIGHFYAQLRSNFDSEIKVGYSTYVLYTEIRDDFIVGLILSYKNHKMFLESHRDENNKLLVSKRELAEDVNGTEASIFALNPGNLKGMIYSYFGSISEGSMYRLFSKIHNSLKRSMITAHIEEIEEVNPDMARSASRSKAEGHFSGDFKLKILVSEADIKSLLALYGKISAIQVNVVEGLIDAPKFKPLEHFSSSSMYSIKIDKDKSCDRVKAALLSIFRRSDADEVIRIIGKSIEGEELNQYIGENREDYGRIDYDDYVRMLPDVKWEDFSSSEAMNNLLNRLGQYTETFGTPPAANTWRLRD